MKTTKMLGILVLAVWSAVLFGPKQQASGGTLAGWGRNDYGQCDVPAGNNIVTIDCGGVHSLALKSDGSLAAWGWNAYGQCDVPAGKDFADVAAGGRHNIALKSDGSVVGWGYDDHGECNVPAGNDFVSVACGYYHSLALRSDGSLAVWGWNNYGQCDVPASNAFVAIAAGGYHSLALRSDGTLAAWGRNDYGQTDVPAGNDFVAVACGYYHSLALKSAGSLAAWGNDDYGQVSNVPADSNFVAIVGGSWHNLVLKSDGSPAAWGRNDYGQCDVPAGNDFAAVAAGGSHSLAITMTVQPMGTAFTYQGQLLDEGSAADGLYDFQFKLYDIPDSVFAMQQGSTIDINDLDVIDGQFAIELDFGSDPNIFNGDTRWLEIGVRPGDSNDVNDFVTLSPRQEVTPMPYAIYAKTAGYTQTAAYAETAEIPVPLQLTGSVYPRGVIQATNTHGAGTAVYGMASNANDVENYGGYFHAEGRYGKGVYGFAYGGNGAGVYGMATGGSGRGVSGYATGSSGRGVQGASDSGNYGYLGGKNIGVYGVSSAGHAGYFQGKVYVSDNVGIGTTSPAAKLEVNGQVKITGGSPGANKVLTSDVEGLASWQVDGGDNDWMVSGNNMYSIPSGRVAIGTIGPQLGYKLTVDGGSSNGIYVSSVGDTGIESIGINYGLSGSGNSIGVLGKGTGGVGSLGGTFWGGVYICTRAGDPVIKLNDDGQTTTKVLKITGGSDLSEQFEVSGEGGQVKPGMVVCIDPENPGNLVVSKKTYDRTVAGIVSGAGGVKPGMLMGQKGTEADGEHPVALTGRVYCWADASNGPIEPGDLLTTSDSDGHAMKVTDYTKAQGAILGKAMSSLGEGRDLVLVLVSLQ